MNDEQKELTKAAAERLRKDRSYGGTVVRDIHQERADETQLAAAYLAEHPADAAAAVSDESLADVFLDEYFHKGLTRAKLIERVAAFRIAAVRAEHADGAEPVDGWQPIETAPKCGVAVVGWGPAVGINLVYWSPTKTQWCKSEASAEYQLGPTSITHWIGLPDRPKAM